MHLEPELKNVRIKDVIYSFSNIFEGFLSAATLVAADYGFTCPPRFMSVCLFVCLLGRTKIKISQPCAV